MSAHSHAAVYSVFKKKASFFLPLALCPPLSATDYCSLLIAQETFLFFLRKNKRMQNKIPIERSVVPCRSRLKMQNKIAATTTMHCDRDVCQNNLQIPLLSSFRGFSQPQLQLQKKRNFRNIKLPDLYLSARFFCYFNFVRLKIEMTRSCVSPPHNTKIAMCDGVDPLN